jgi:hypothetical protein
LAVRVIFPPTPPIIKNRNGTLSLGEGAFLRFRYIGTVGFSGF